MITRAILGMIIFVIYFASLIADFDQRYAAFFVNLLEVSQFLLTLKD
jgi:hypothetical protein